MCPWDKKEEANKKKQEFAVASSDHLALLQAYKVDSPINMHAWIGEVFGFLMGKEEGFPVQKYALSSTRVESVVCFGQSLLIRRNPDNKLITKCSSAGTPRDQM